MLRIAATAMLIGSALLAGCGNRTALAPEPGKNLPVAPYGRTASPSADELLTPPAQARPERSIELRSRSEDREQDPFDLPPED